MCLHFTIQLISRDLTAHNAYEIITSRHICFFLFFLLNGDWQMVQSMWCIYATRLEGLTISGGKKTIQIHTHTKNIF